MMALDTNVLVRLLVNDPNEQSQINTAKSILINSKSVYISQIVQVETVWVLETAYGFDKDSIISVLKHLNLQSVFKLQAPQFFSSALDLFATNSADFSDCLILLESTKKDQVLATFDKKLGKLSGTKFLSSS